MLNMKKGLAIVLAAATALTFAPVANLGQAVTANATEFRNAQNKNLVVGDEMDYEVSIDNIKVGENLKIQNTNPDVIGVDVDAASYSENDITTANTDTAQSNKNSFVVEALKKGSATLTITYPQSNGVDATKTITYNVTNPSSDIQFTFAKTSESLAAVDSFGYKATNVADDYQLGVKNSAAGDTWTVDANGVSSSNTDVIAVTTNNENTTTTAKDTLLAKLQLKKAGTATLTVSATVKTAGTYSDATVGAKKKFQVTINVIANGSTFKIGDTEITANDSTPIVTAGSENIKKTIYLTATNPSASIGATLANPQVSGDKIVYTAYKEDAKDLTAVEEADKTSEITVSDNGTVTATANALNATEQYYFVKVSLAKEAGKTAWVRVITTRQDKAFTSLKVNVEGKDYEAKASYGNQGQVVDSTDKTVAVQMSTKDKTTVPFTVTSTNDYEVKSNDTSTVDVVNGQLVAKRVGVAAVTISTKPNVTYYGAATITINVTVKDQLLNTKIVADPATISLNKVTKSAKINASVVATPALAKQPTLSYQFVTKNADGTYTKANSADLDLAADGTVTYKTTAEGSAIVEVSTPATNDYTEPAKAYVTVNYSSKKIASALKVDATAVNVAAGETATVAATGTAITVKSSDDAVATASYADGKVSVVGVKKGVAVVTVTDAGNDNYEGSSAQIVVYVAGAKMTKPAKVTGVKVTNLKGGKVKVTWAKVGTNPNVKYYVKKTVNGKSAGKSVNGTKTTLTVKKGATVKVKVKAYIYDENNEKFVGSYSSTVSKKTDKK